VADNFKIINTNASELLRVASDGKVGIGTTSPEAKLHVQGDAKITGSLTAGSYVMEDITASSSISAPIFYDTDNPLYFLDPHADANGNSLIVAGKVGIGTTSPATFLDVRGPVMAPLSIFSTTADTVGDQALMSFAGYNSANTRLLYGVMGIEIKDPAEGSENGAIVFKTIQDGSLGEKVRINPSGNVGIGTTAPSSKLEIKDSLPIITLNDSDVTGYSQIDGGGTNLKLMADEGNDVANSFINFRIDGTERMRITHDGNVGIGGIPEDKLTVIGGRIRLDNAQSIVFEKSDGTDDGTEIIRYGGNALRIRFNNNLCAFDSLADKPVQIRNSSDTTKIQLHPAGTSYFVGGNVGIGTTNPGAKLDVSGVSQSTGLRVTGLSQLSSGEGVEIVYNSGSNAGFISSYDFEGGRNRCIDCK